mmetsp:Transcript_2283/g.6308  ORF Transcript_2283/g.6308 Transcript_2283/m.6308 type:complete len:284 (+) Transcript_2283:66-917(+)
MRRLANQPIPPRINLRFSFARLSMNSDTMASSSYFTNWVTGPPMVITDNSYYVAEAIHQLGWDKEDKSVVLIGHSMGAAVSLMYSAAFPEQISKLILLEAAGPQTKKPSDTAKHLRAHLDRRFRNTRKPEEASIYPNIEVAARLRVMTAKAFPGDQYISAEAARMLVERASEPTGDGEDAPIRFLFDQRLKWPSIQYFAEEQVHSFYRVVAEQVDSCLLLGDDGWPASPAETQFVKGALQPNKFEVLPGSHHFHMDPDTYEAVANSVYDFLITPVTATSAREE